MQIAAITPEFNSVLLLLMGVGSGISVVGFLCHGIGFVGQVCLVIGGSGHVGAGVGQCFDLDGDQSFARAVLRRKQSIAIKK